MKGEVYFEIAHTKNAQSFKIFVLPFRSGEMSAAVEATGTKFMISAYDDLQPKKITLVDGSVKLATLTDTECVATFENPSSDILSDKLKTILNPGEQAEVAANGSITVNKKIDRTTMVNWEKGYLHFEKTPTHEVIKQLQSWFHVGAVYNSDNIT